MKKIKILFAIPAVVAVLPATLVLSQCGIFSSEEVFALDDSVSSKMTMKVEDDEQKNAICTLQLNNELIQKNKIESVKVKFNNIELKENEYKIELDTGVEGQAQAIIYSNTRDYKKGAYTIIPTIVSKKMTGIIADVERKSYVVGEKVTKDNIKVYQSLEGTQGDQIPWTTDIKVYDGETLISDFITNGLELTTYGATKVLTIKYDTFSTVARIPVSKKQYKVSCSIDSDECATLSTDSFYADEGTVWGTINKPAPSGKADVWSSSLNWTWVDTGTGKEIAHSAVIKNDMSAKMKISLPAAKSSKSLDFTKSTNLFSGGTSYVPEACMPSTSLQYTTLSTDIEYSFNITVPTDTTIKWFWFYNGSQYRQGELMHIYKNNIISIKDGAGADIAYTFVEHDQGGNYIEFNDAVAGDTKIQITFRMLRDFNNCIIPVFQHQQ